MDPVGAVDDAPAGANRSSGGVMDRNSAATLTRYVTGLPNRRDVVRGLLGVGLGISVPGIPEVDGRKKGKPRKKKPKKPQKPCAACQRRINGRCIGAEPDGARCGECGFCLSGECTPGMFICADPCMACDATARCRLRKADDAPCLRHGKCLKGICNQRPTCEPAGTECTVVDGEVDPECCAACCSGACRSIPGAGAFCRQGLAGSPCFDSTDCAEKLTCIGYRCG